MPTLDAPAAPALTPLHPPSQAHVRQSLSKLLGRDAFEGLWAEVCAEAGVPLQGALDLDALERVAAALCARGGLAAVTGRSLAVRVRTYRRLASQADPAVGDARADAPAPEGPELSLLRRPARLAEVARLGLDRPAEDAPLAAALAEAAAALGVPTVITCAVLDDAQVLHAGHGVSGRTTQAAEVPIEWGICRRVVTVAGAVVVEDATASALTRATPFVVEDGARCYAGVPLVSYRGEVVGSVCALGPAARDFSDTDLARLRQVARAVVARLEARAAEQADATGRAA
jgi:hypothetical protein